MFMHILDHAYAGIFTHIPECFKVPNIHSCYMKFSPLNIENKCREYSNLYTIIYIQYREHL